MTLRSHLTTPLSTLLVVSLIGLFGNRVDGATLTYIDADLANTTASTPVNSSVDSLWYFRPSGGWTDAEGGDHMLTTDASLNTSFITIDYSLAGLTAGSTADVYLLFGENGNSDGMSYSFDDITYFTVTPATPGVVEVDNVGAGTPITTGDVDKRFRYLVGQITSNGSNEGILYVGLGNGPRTQFDGVAFAEFVTAPEPSTAVLVVMGMVGLFGCRRRRRNA